MAESLIASLIGRILFTGLKAELSRINLSQFQSQEHILHTAEFHVFSYLKGPDTMKLIDAALPVEINQDASPVKNDISNHGGKVSANEWKKQNIFVFFPNAA